MTNLVVRKLFIDLSQPFERRWNNNDAFLSAFFNALSMSFVVGEQYFIDSLRAGLSSMNENDRIRFENDIKWFIGQEATHRRLHNIYNKQLENQGFDNKFERRANARINAAKNINIKNHVGITAATEHFTTMFAFWVLSNPSILEKADKRLKNLWEWHCAEEIEHRSIAFDMYKTMGGNHNWRLRTYRYVTITFLLDVLRQTINNLYKDKALFKISTWRSAWKYIFSKSGLITSNVGLWKAYLKEDFHPNMHSGLLSSSWLLDNSNLYREIPRTS